MEYRNWNINERGVVSALGLCVLMVILLLALAAARFVRSGSDAAAAYEREVQLRLAAESAVETAATKLAQPSFAAEVQKQLSENPQPRIEVDDVPMADRIELHVYVEKSKDLPVNNGLSVFASAVDCSEPSEEDGKQWKKGMFVRALLEKKDKRYVWRRWF